MNRRRFVWSALGVALASGIARAADAYPRRKSETGGGDAAGTVLDMLARRVAAHLAKATGQQVIVDNKPGASGTLGASAVANATPDGYTLFYGGASELGLAPILFPNLPYLRDKPFAPITRFTRGSAILLVSPALPVSNIQDLVKLAKARPGGLKGGSPGTGTLTHLLLLALNHAAGIEIMHVPYKSGVQAMSDVMAGHIDMMFDWTISSRAFTESGKLRPVLIAGSARKPYLPNIPAATELGWKDLDFHGWNAFLAPGRTPRAIVSYLNKTLTPILHAEEFQMLAATAGSEIVTLSPEETAAFLAREQERYRELVRLTGVKVE